MLRLAIVGAGWAGTRQVEAIRELGRKITVECLVDNDSDHLSAQSGKLGVRKVYGEVNEALNDQDVDAISIALPHALHCEVAVAAAEAGKHVLVEKPMAMSVDEATQMMEAADRAGVRIFVAENIAYEPMSQFLREIVRTGKHIGEIVSASFSRGFRAPQYGFEGRRAWLSTPERGGSGTWLLHGIHSIAQVRYVLGEVDTVYVREHHAKSFQRTDLEGTMSGVLMMDSGFVVSVLQTCEARIKGAQSGFVIHGDKGSIQACEDGCNLISTEGAEELRLDYPDSSLSSYALELEAFVDLIEDGIEGPTTAQSERRSLAVIQAGYESARTGQPVCLKDRFGSL